MRLIGVIATLGTVVIMYFSVRFLVSDSKHPVTEANYKSISIGMTESEVVAILGRAGFHNRGPTIAADAGYYNDRWTWRVKYEHGSVTEIALHRDTGTGNFVGRFPADKMFQGAALRLLVDGEVDSCIFANDGVTVNVFMTASSVECAKAKTYGIPEDAIIRVYFKDGRAVGKMYWKQLREGEPDLTALSP